MQNTYVKKFDRWTKELNSYSFNGRNFTILVTLRDSSGLPDSLGVETIDWFLSDFESQWKSILDKLTNLNSCPSSEFIENAIVGRLCLFSPAIDNSDKYDLMIIVDIEMLGKQQSYQVCYVGRKIVFSEMHI